MVELGAKRRENGSLGRVPEAEQFCLLSDSKLYYERSTCFIIITIIFLAHQHKACRQLKIKQEMTAVGD